MSRTEKMRRQNKPNPHNNCVSAAREEARTGGFKNKKEHDAWESKQTFVVIKVDPKTTIYRPASRVKNLKGQILHKGAIK